MTYKGAITIAVLLAPTFALYAGVSLDLALELTALISLAASIGISIPDLEAELALCVQLNLGIQLAIAIGLPSVTVQLGLSFSAQLVLVESLLVSLAAILAISDASLEVFTYEGPGANLGTAVGGAISSGWADGTSPEATVDAVVLAATSPGSSPLGELATVTLLGGGAGYERGLASISFSGSSTTPATGTLTINPATGTITGVTVSGHGAGYVDPPTATISDTVSITGCTNASPIVLSIPDTTDVTAITVAGVKGNGAANGQWCAKVLSPTTIALYEDGAFTQPSVGNGAWQTGTGSVTGNGSGAAAVPVMGGGSIAQLLGFFSGVSWAPGLIEQGSITIAGLCPVTFGLLTDIEAELQLEAKVLGNAKLNFGLVPPRVAGNAQIIGGIDANIAAALRLVPPLPSVQANMLATVNGRAAIVLGLTARIAAQLGFATEDLMILTYSGPGSGLGPALSAELATEWPDHTPSNAPSNVLILGATSPAASAALDVFMPAAA